jgi:hypothetical protein
MGLANTLAYHDTATITAVESFIVQYRGDDNIRCFFFVTNAEANKLGYLSLPTIVVLGYKGPFTTGRLHATLANIRLA